MPMEYDDNDFEDHNHHLTGEGSSKFSPGLRSYAIPKFDFSDSLHGPLRFDSLVENEVFLGIPSQEESNWIEDFSRESGAIEFGSRGAESCSIVRHNNAWSEAASSESVEMLLKSVGQEEMVPGEAIIEESEPCDVLDNLNEQIMSCYPSQVGSEEGNANSKAPLPSDNVLGNLSGTNDNEGISQVKVTEISLLKNSYGVDQNTVSERQDMTVVEKNVTGETNCDTANITELQTPDKDLLYSDAGKYPSAGMTIYGASTNSISSSQNAVASEALLSHGESHDLKSASPSNDTGDAVNKVLSVHMEAAEGNTIRGSTFASVNWALDDLPHPPLEADSEEVHQTNSVIEEPSCMPLVVNHESEITDFSKHACPKDSNQQCDKILADISENVGNTIQLKASNDSDLIAYTDNQDLNNCDDVSNPISGMSPNSEMTKTSCCLNFADEGKQNLQENDEQLESKPSLTSTVDSIALGNSMELVAEKQIRESVEGMINDCGIHKEYLNANEPVSPSTLAKNFKITQGSIVSGKDNDDTSFSEKENARPLSESIDVEADNIGSFGGEDRVVSVPDEKILELAKGIDFESEHETVAMDNAVSNIPFQARNLVHVDLKVQAPLPHLEPMSVGEMENIDAETLKETNGSTRESPVVVDNLYPVPELEKSASYGSSRELKHDITVQSLPIEKICVSVVDSKNLKEQDMFDQSLPVAYTSDVANVNEQLIHAKECSPDSSDKFEVGLISCDPQVKEGTGSVVPESLGDNQVASTVCPGGDHSCQHDSEILHGVSSPNHQGKEGEVRESSIKISLLPEEVKVDVAPKVDPSTMGMTSSSEWVLKEKSNKGTPSSTVRRTLKKSMGSAVSPSTPVVDQMVSKLASDVSCGTSKGTVEALSIPKDTSEHKTRRWSGRARGKDGAKKGSTENEIPSAKQSEKESKSLTTPLINSDISLPVQFEGLKSYGKVEHGGASCLTPLSSSKLPDLNTSLPPSSLFKQPFTDLQHLQLRAQILVHGSLRQGAVPDETCMVSAFGVPDGGRILDPVWRASLERLKGARSLEQQIKQSVPQTTLSSTVGRQSNMEPPPVGNSILPLSSSLWNASSSSFESLHSSGAPRSVYPYYHQASLPLNPYQTPPSRGFGPSTWQSKGPFPGPWVATTPSSAPDGNARLSGRSMTEAVKLTPTKEESSEPVISGLKHGSLTAVQIGSSSIPANISMSELNKDLVASKQITGEVKSRKRKKAPDWEDAGPTSLPPQSQTHRGTGSSLVSPTHISTSLVISTSNVASKGNAGNIVASLQPAPPSTNLKSLGKRPQQSVLISEDSSAKVEDSKQQAENAAVLAAAAINQRQNIWNQLAKQKNSNIVSEDEAKLVSAALAIDAASSVARAAAAAAQVASNAALQAKAVADEALSSIGTWNSDQMTTASLSDVVNNLVRLDADSISNGSNPSIFPIILAAKEAALRRTESAASSSRNTENLDAILKAAELAANAVAQAGKIIAMNDHLPLSQLLESGQWRVPQLPPHQVPLLSDIYREPYREVPPKHYPNASGTHYKFPFTSGEIPMESAENTRVTAYGNLEININVKKEATSNRLRRASDMTKAILPESGTGPSLGSCTSIDLVGEETANQHENRIKEGCLVEVCKEGVNGQVGWFPATVLNLKDGKAFVHFMDLKSDSGPIKEWITLEAKGSMAPKIRTPHPITVTQLEGAKKRRRAALGDYMFSSGDRVDVWVQYWWQEGIVIEKNKKDEATFTVGFPGEIEKMVVSAWYIRPTLVWCDGEWIDWSSTRGRNQLSQGDTPQEKRLKRGDSMTTTNKENDKRSKPIDFVGGSKLLPLSSSQQVFKPGKSRKFMEGIGTRGWKNNLKVDRKENQGAELKAKSSRPGKPPNIPNQPLPQNKKVLPSAMLARQEDNIDHAVGGDSNATDESRSGQQSQMEIGSLNTKGEEELPMNVHQQRPSDRSENNGKAAAPHGGRMDRVMKVNKKDLSVDYGKSELDVSEPRRSSRKIQPTSRLLEGLQTSLVISKFPSVSHDKTHRSHTSKGNGHG